MKPSSFFLLRTPLLPISTFLNWGEPLAAPGVGGTDPSALAEAVATDRQRLRAGLRELLGRPEVREAVFVGSPELAGALNAWEQDPESERGSRAERSVVRYFARMCSRATPYGLFAGYSVGQVGERTTLRVGGVEECRRHATLDMDYLCRLADLLASSEEFEGHVLLRPNSSLHATGNRLLYAEGAATRAGRSYYLVGAEATSHLMQVLERARDGASGVELAQAVAVGEITFDTAMDFIRGLVEAQILMPDLAPPVTREAPLEGMIRRLEGCGVALGTLSALRSVRSHLNELDGCPPGAGGPAYEGVMEAVKALPPPVDPTRLVQMDLVRPGLELSLGREVLEEVGSAVEWLRRINRGYLAHDMLERFRKTFIGRYEGREVPLLEALDEENGVGFNPAQGPGVQISPLLEGFQFPPGVPGGQVEWGKRDGILLNKILAARAANAAEIVLTTAELEGMAIDDAPPLPGAFAVLMSLGARSEEDLAEGRWRAVLEAMNGPSGMTLLGRFCHGDPALTRLVEEAIREEEAQRPDAVFAEIVHLPEGRIGNIVARPSLRRYEIPYLGASGASESDQIPVSDLWVKVEGGRILLRSRRLGKEVLPRLSNAHNFTERSLGVYRFLSVLQYQGVANALGWDWGGLADADFLPRVVWGRVVLARATWRVQPHDLGPLVKVVGGERLRACRDMRLRVGLPRLVMWREGDNRLLVDFENVLSLDGFVEAARVRPEVVLEEFLPGPDEICAQAKDGGLVHDMIVPFFSQGGPSETGMAGPLVDPAGGVRRFIPGGECLYLKVYGSGRNLDDVLRSVVSRVLERGRAGGAIQRWFFIRYADPDTHLRLRFFGSPDALLGGVLPELNTALRPFELEGLVWKVQTDTYEREVERYGGWEAMPFAESLFEADSDAALATLQVWDGEILGDSRWRMCLLGMDALLGDLGFGLKRKFDMARRARAAYLREFALGRDFEHQLGDRFRKERRGLEALLTAPQEAICEGGGILRKRSERIRPLMAELTRMSGEGRLSVGLEDLAASLLHMHANRMLRSDQRVQEMVIFDYLSRLYQSQLAKAPKRIQEEEV